MLVLTGSGRLIAVVLAESTFRQAPCLGGERCERSFLLIKVWGLTCGLSRLVHVG